MEDDDIHEAPKRVRRRRRKSGVIVSTDDVHAPYTEDASIEVESAPDTPDDELPPGEPVEEPVTRDIGNWRYTPWKGVDMWTHTKSRLTTFNEGAARHLRNKPHVDAASLQTYSIQSKQRAARKAALNS